MLKIFRNFFSAKGYLQPEKSSDTLIYRKKLISSLPEELSKEKDKNKQSARMAACASYPGSCSPYKGFSREGFLQEITLQNAHAVRTRGQVLKKEE